MRDAVVNIRQSAWYRGFDGAKDVIVAIQSMEKAFRAWMAEVCEDRSQQDSALDSQPDVRQQEQYEQDLQAQLFENELWFRRLYAVIVNFDEQGEEFVSQSNRIVGRDSFQRALKTFKQEAARLTVRDRELLAAMTYADRIFLEGLPAQLSTIQAELDAARDAIEKVVRNSEGKVIRQRASKGRRVERDEEPRKTDGRELVRYLVEACLKTYLFCDIKVIRNLTKYQLSSVSHLREPALKQLIQSTGDRKLDNAQRWRLDEPGMLELSSRYLVPIGMVIQHWQGDPPLSNSGSS